QPAALLALTPFPTRRSSDLWIAPPYPGRDIPVPARSGRSIASATAAHGRSGARPGPIAGGHHPGLGRPSRLYARLHEQPVHARGDRKSTRLNSSHVAISYAV